MENQQGHLHENMHTGAVNQRMNHSAHELLDVREALMGSIGAMNQYTMLRQYVKDPELLNILDRQYSFMQMEYNTTIDCFRTGQDPTVPTKRYNMTQDNDFIYGLKPSQPSKPIQSVNEMTDENVSGCLLASQKSNAAMKTMAALESTNPVVRRVLADSLPNCIEMAYELSIYQNKHHYYQVPQFAQQDMEQIVNMFAPAEGNQQGSIGNVNH
ncbi:spore coat protein [Peribacillus saganii]|uniref:Spore coat protein n=1 Tax=Peribacillus saganii TaxID=2303992 RepID=A0A372LKS0_9BACI|nr:spore coat protein [Peribacillus saganii]RFU67349.1 spore coat protein [Peribacillus saganii]